MWGAIAAMEDHAVTLSAAPCRFRVTRISMLRFSGRHQLIPLPEKLGSTHLAVKETSWTPVVGDCFVAKNTPHNSRKELLSDL